ncbi:MAG: hypothetical protein DMG59_25630, partial [Acidobacteria bacterium]
MHACFTGMLSRVSRITRLRTCRSMRMAALTTSTDSESSRRPATRALCSLRFALLLMVSFRGTNVVRGYKYGGTNMGDKLCLLKLMAVLAGMLAVSRPVSAQILYGSIVGNVKDPSDAAVAGAKVTIVNKETSQTRETVTNDAGGYSFPTVAAGPYELRVTREGFRTATESEVLVTINSVTRADVKLQLGAVAESVMVTAAAASLQTDRSEVRAEIQSERLVNLPVQPGRNYQQLFKTIPGFRPPTNAHSVPTNPSRALTFNVNGASHSINNTRIDGASSIALWLPHATAFVPTIEAIQEVNVGT